MDEQRFNMSMRKFLKEVGVTSQQAIERVVRDESLGGKGKLKVKMVLTADGTDLHHEVVQGGCQVLCVVLSAGSGGHPGVALREKMADLKRLVDRLRAELQERWCEAERRCGEGAFQTCHASPLCFGQTRDVDVGLVRILQQQADELAASRDRGPVVEFVD